MKSLKLALAAKTLLVAIALPFAAPQASAEALKIGYSDWPGWVAWEIGVQKGWFKEAGVDVKFEWFEYVASMDAFAAGQIDSVCVTNGDALVTGSTGAANVMILINDYSNGNDMVVARPGIKSIKDLKGKKIGVEIGFVSHLLLLNGLEKAGLSEADVELVNMPTHQAAQTLASGDVDAIVAWQPNSGESLKALAGSTRVYSSADQKGLIYDALVVTPSSLANHREEWKKVIQVWYRIVDYVADPATADDAISIMASRVNLTAEQYKPFLAGTRILNSKEVKSVFAKNDGFSSLHGSTKIVDDFNVKNKVYDAPQNIDSYIDLSLSLEVLK